MRMSGRFRLLGAVALAVVVFFLLSAFAAPSSVLYDVTAPRMDDVKPQTRIGTAKPAAAAAGVIVAAGAAGAAQATAPPAAADDDDAPAPAVVLDGVAPGTRVPLLYLTALSSNHFRWMVRLLDNVKAVDKAVPYLVIDLGLTPAERDYLASIDGLTVRAFEFSKYPPYFDVKVAAGEYAFKPIVIRDALEIADVVVWMDSSDYLNEALSKHLLQMRSMGFYSSISSGQVQDWTHPGMLKYYGLEGRSDVLARTNCNAAFLIFVREATLDQLVKPWVECALTKACIAPEGSSRANHRQDQAALSLLVYTHPSGRFTCGWGSFGGMHNIHQENNEFFDLRTVRGVGTPATIATAGHLRQSVLARFPLGPDVVLALDTLTHALTVTEVDGLRLTSSRTGVQAAAAAAGGPSDADPVSALDVLADVYLRIPPRAGQSIVLIDGSRTGLADRDHDSLFTNAVTARFLLALLGTSRALFSISADRLEELTSVVPAIGQLDWAPPADSGPFAAMAAHASASVANAVTSVLWPSSRLIPEDTKAGPALLHIAAPSLADVGARLALARLLREQPGVNVLVIVGGPVDGLQPWVQVADLAAKGWPGNGPELVLAWLTPAGTTPTTGGAPGSTGCARVWGPKELATFRASAEAAQLHPASYSLGTAVDRPGCLLLAVAATVNVDTETFRWREAA